MRIEQLAFALEIDRQNSMKAAAEHLFITPQALSSAVKSLEEELGITIFNRSNKGISLTPEGEKFIDFAESTINNYQHLLNEIAHVQEMPATLDGKLTLYVAPVFYESILPDHISDFKLRFPNISLALVQRNCQSITHTLIDRFTDSTIGGIILPFDGDRVLPAFLPDHPEDYSYKILNRNTYYACVPQDSPLASQKSVTVNKLLKYPLVDYCAGDIGTSPLVSLLRRYKPDFAISMTIASFAHWAQAISYNVGVGVMNAAFDDPTFDGYRYLEDLHLIKINDPLVTYNCFIYKKDPSPSARAFLSLFPEYVPRKNEPDLHLGQPLAEATGSLRSDRSA